MDGLPPIEPDDSPERREEVGRIDFLLEEIRKLRDRGVVPAGAVEAVEAEWAPRRAEVERRGLVASTLKAARRAAPDSPQAALTLAGRARDLAPDDPAAWELTADLLGRLGAFDRAVATCREAAEAHGHAAILARVAGFEAEKARRDHASAVEQAVSRARSAASGGDLGAVVEDCRAVLELDPRHHWALATAVGYLVEFDRLDEAEALAERLRAVAPREGAEWVTRIRVRRGRAAIPPLARRPAPIAAPAVPDIRFAGDPDPGKAKAPAPAGPGFSAIARGFLEDHWQKLILSLAVLLIVVSSTVGAAVVLGDRLWMAEGKCLLATAYTLMFAGFGRGLARWGAVRAGRIMRLTTLIVLPVNFALVGELPGLGRASATGLAVLAVDSAAMIGLALMVCRSLGISGGRGTPAALVALGMLDALTPRSASFGWGFGAILAASGLFAGSGERLARWLGRDREAGEEPGEESPYFAFGLLAFSYGCVLARVGGSVLGLPPTLYALPAMLAAFAAIRASDGLRASGRAGPPEATLRLGGYALTALAFALGLARPEARLPLYSGNTLAAALVGLALYARALRLERRPAFLYAGFAALFLAYFGVHEFLKDYLTGLEGEVSRSLGYGRKLPRPFKALNGLAFNAFLAGLSVFFARRWKDDRLAWHGHLIGIPLSIGACAFSSLDPTAGLLTMGGYAVAYALASWVFAAPGVVYLACAAFAGAALSASGRLGELAAGPRSLSLAAVGLALWAACRGLAVGRVPDAYRVPVARSARVVAVVALGFAARAAWPWDPPTWSAAWACLALAGLYVLIGTETPVATAALAAGACAAAGALLMARLAGPRQGWPVDGAWLGAWAAAIGATYQAAGPWVEGLADRRAGRLGRPSRLAVYPGPLAWLGLVLAGLATSLAGAGLIEALPGPSARDLAGVAAAMGLVGLGLGLGARRAGWLAGPTVLAGSVGAVAAAMAAGARLGWPAPETFAVACPGVGLILVGLGDRLRDRSETYRRPLLGVAALGVGLAWLAVAWTWPGDRAASASLALAALALGLATRQVPGRAVATLALAGGLAAWVSGWGIRPDPARLGLLVLVYLVEALAAAELGRLVRRGRSLVAALPGFVQAVAPVGLALGATGLVVDDWARLTGSLTLGSAVYLGLGGLGRRPGLARVGLVLAWLATLGATRWAVGDGAPGVVLGWLALASAVDGLAAGGLRWAASRRGPAGGWIGALGDLGTLLAVAAVVLGVAGPALTLDAYPMAVAGLMLTIPGLLGSAAIDRSAWRTRGAIVAGVAAAYLTLFEAGRGRSGHVSTLGVLASLLAVATWAIHRVASRAGWHRAFSAPAREATIVLATLAVVPEWGRAGPLLLASVPFLLMIRADRRAFWLYPGLGLALASGAFAADGRWGFGALEPFAVAAGFACWGLALGLARRPAFPGGDRAEDPPVHLAVVLGFLALGLRAFGVFEAGEPWASRAWVLAGVGILSLLIVRFDPVRWWVDGAALLLSVAAIQAVGQRLDSPMAWALAALSMALGWRGLERGLAPIEGGLGRRLGVGLDRPSRVFGQWSLGFLAVGGGPMAGLVVLATLSATLGAGDPGAMALPIGWREGLVALLLLGANAELAGRAALGEAGRLVPHGASTLVLWWLLVPGSPVPGWVGLGPAVLLPVLTAAQALVLSLAGRGDGPAARYGAGLALVAAVLTGGRPGWASTFTLLAGAAAEALVAVRARRPEAAAITAALWAVGLGYLADRVATALGLATPLDRPVVIALGQAAAALGLVAAGGWDRRRGLGLARVIEGVAAVSMAVACGAIGVSCLENGDPGRALAGVGVMAAVGSMAVALASRWESMTMAFAAQGALLLGYAALRSGFALSPTGDAAAMLILAGVDLGVAEVAGRGRRAFALPSLATGLALPLVAVGLAFRGGPIGDVPLFTLFAAGTFYAATCTRLRWRGLGYAAAVLYNAGLWMLWARFGWAMAESPQLYVVPVGFSTILFAQANARELGRSRVNAIRGAGLALIYLSLAVPIWQTASLGAWAAVLAVSLAGIFAGIGLRSQAFLWLGLAGFVLDVTFQLGRIGMEHALAKWAIMLGLGVSLVLFVALNEKRQLLATLRKYVAEVQDWD